MFKQEVRGHFTLYSNKRGKLCEFTNLITDVGMDSFIRQDIGSSHGIVVGRGTTVPTVNDTVLGSIVAGSNTATPRFSTGYNVLPGNPYGCMYQRAVRFSEGAVVGNISEIGFVYFTGSSRTTNYSLLARSLIKDANGNPTTITLLSDEILDVVYQIFFYTSVGEVSGVLNFSGNIGGTYAWRLLPAYVTTFAVDPDANGWIGYTAFSYVTSRNLKVSSQGIGTATTGINGGAYTNNTATTISRMSNYVAGSFKVPFALSLPSESANLAGGIRSVQFRAGKGMYQIEFTPAIPKTSLDSVLIEFEMQISRGT